jgi:hypothetical protein
MHPNFYHWHSRVDLNLKPDPAILEPRWNAAAKFAEKLIAADVSSLLRLFLFPRTEIEFSKRFNGELVKLEPTFPPDSNAQLLRVMAAASIYSQMDSSTVTADAFALGLQAAAFPPSRIEPITKDVIARAGEYLAAESERMRPRIYAGTLAKAEKQTEVHLVALKKAVEANGPQEIGKATESLGRGVLGAMKESHQQLGEVIGRLTEESQFLWWLIGEHSSALDMRRKELAVEAYALPAAAEAADRVSLLPPAASVESLLDEVLAQCGKGTQTKMLLSDLFAATKVEWIQRAANSTGAADLTPLASMLAVHKAGEKPDASSLKLLRIQPKTKASPQEAARQYFRELMFLRSIQEVG